MVLQLGGLSVRAGWDRRVGGGIACDAVVLQGVALAAVFLPHSDRGQPYPVRQWTRLRDMTS